jgi:putative salt-induced outer membrane protein YdiY
VKIRQDLTRGAEEAGSVCRGSWLLASLMGPFISLSTLRRSMVVCAVIGVSLWLSANSVSAETPPSDEAPAHPLWAGSWEPPKPNAAGWDWVRLKSDEWVKGEILLLRDFDLNFDSDEFGIVKFDWEDVAEILTERVYIFVLQDLRTSYVGTMVMRDDRVSVKVGGKIETFDRSQLLAITPSAEREFNLWNGRISVGAGFRSGNTEQSEFTGRANLSREGTNTRLGIEYNGEYGSLDKVKNTNNHRAQATYDYFLTRDLFLTPGDFEAYTDEFQNISYRLTPTVGAGYFLIRHPQIDWEVRLTTGYQHTRIDSARAGESKTSENAATVFSTTIDSELTSSVDLIIEYQLQFITPDTGRTNHHAVSRLEVELTSVIDLDVSFIWDRIEDPETESDGDTPETDDFRLAVGLAIEF